MDLDADGKITFREFAHGITPEYPGNSNAVTTNNEEVKGVEFNVERKVEIKRQHEEMKS
jgi:hypothetical protein